jgi:hypothetical protein
MKDNERYPTHLRIAQGASIIIRNALYIPNATVRLISVGCLVDDSNATAHWRRAGSLHYSEGVAVIVIA